ncbi:hypothetical protein G5I_02172 [Acromyrmex echinatior]|uniref:Uncharacterized protein n=1 Tax=Acromyrmex echinatior TaxID=103372 RepID=F4W9L8_ACREC|nr:hypothetical protein G5I_02172 [Acromyrmex echinatior]
MPRTRRTLSDSTSFRFVHKQRIRRDTGRESSNPNASARLSYPRGGFSLSPRGVDRFCVIRFDLEESHNTRAPSTNEFEANAAWSRLIDYRVARNCLTTGWSSIVPSHGLSVKKRTNHDGVGCYSNMAARQYAAQRRGGKRGKVSLPVMPFSGSPLRSGNVYPGLIRSSLPCHGFSQGCILPWHSPESSPDLATLPLALKITPIAPIAIVVTSVVIGIL